MDILIEAWVRRDRMGIREKVTEATFTFVAIGEDGKSRPIPDKDQIPAYVIENFGNI